MTLSLAAMQWLEARGLDIELADRLGLTSQSGASGEALVYPTIVNGQHVGNKYRPLTPQEGRPRFWRDKGTPSAPFNGDVLLDDSLISEPLIVTEGYEDAMCAIQSGFTRTISVPDGAPEKPVENIDQSDKYAWIDQLYEKLKMDRVKAIILAVDGDPAGAALLHDLSVKLGKTRCKFVTYPKAKDPKRRDRERLKDLNEVLEDYGTRGVQAVLERAQYIKVNGVYSMGQLPPLAADTVYDIGFEAFSEHYKMRLGDLTVVTGIPGYGKTTWINDVVCRVSHRYGVRAAWASFEQSPQRDHRRSLRSWYAGETGSNTGADSWIEDHHRFIVPDEDDDASMAWLLDRMEIAVVQHDCKVIILDPWNEIFHDRGGETETDYTNRSIRDLKRFAKSFQIHLIVVAHPAKLQRRDDGLYNTPSLYDVAGSAAWANKPDLGIIVHRTDAETTVVKTAKSRYWDTIGRPGIVSMHFSAETRHFIELERNVVDIDAKRTRGRG